VVDWTSPSNAARDEELVPVWEIRCERAWGAKALELQPLLLLRTMCGSRTGGWSLPGVIND
jgi:hypothetical protein